MKTGIGLESEDSGLAAETLGIVPSPVFANAFDFHRILWILPQTMLSELFELLSCLKNNS